VVPNPSWRLVGALASLKDSAGRVAIEGFYDPVRPLTTRERDVLGKMPDKTESMRETLGLESFLDNLEGYAWREHLYGSPTCNICGLDAGYTGPGLKTVLPARARAKIDFRLVPDQAPQEVLAQLRAHLDRHGFTDIAIEPITAHERPVRTAVDDRWVQIIADASEEYFGVPPSIEINTAGSAPMDALVDEITPSLLFAPGGAGYEGSRVHAPDENIRIPDLVEGIKVTAFLLRRIGEHK
jgi:acetylornithine deacetylase/succinyl-diaminopimelate desuccinylase-like protein